MKTNQSTINAGETIFTVLANTFNQVKKVLEKHNEQANMLADKLKQWMGNKAYEFFDDSSDEMQVEEQNSELETKIQHAADIIEENAVIVNKRFETFLDSVVQFICSCLGIQVSTKENNSACTGITKSLGFTNNLSNVKKLCFNWYYDFINEVSIFFYRSDFTSKMVVSRE